MLYQASALFITLESYAAELKRLSVNLLGSKGVLWKTVVAVLLSYLPVGQWFCLTNLNRDAKRPTIFSLFIITTHTFLLLEITKKSTSCVHIVNKVVFFLMINCYSYDQLLQTTDVLKSKYLTSSSFFCFSNNLYLYYIIILNATKIKSSEYFL